MQEIFRDRANFSHEAHLPNFKFSLSIILSDCTGRRCFAFNPRLSSLSFSRARDEKDFVAIPSKSKFVIYFSSQNSFMAILIQVLFFARNFTFVGSLYNSAARTNCITNFKKSFPFNLLSCLNSHSKF